MNKVSKNEKGFSAIEAILVLVVIVLIGIVGYITYKDHHKTKTANTATSSSSQSKTTASSSELSTTNKASTNSSKKSNTKYLTVTQWGVRTPYTSNDSLSYVIDPNNQNLALVVSQYMADNFGCTASNAINTQTSGAGSISRNSATATASAMSSTPETWSKLATNDPTDYK